MKTVFWYYFQLVSSYKLSDSPTLKCRNAQPIKFCIDWNVTRDRVVNFPVLQNGLN